MPYLHAAGGDIYHEVTGDGAPLVLLHGGFCSIETMRSQIDALSSSYRVHAPERPGHGRSPDHEGPFSFTRMVADTVEYLDLVGLERAHVLGFSDGAIIGLLLALGHPERVASLTAVSANLDPSGLVEDDDGGHHDSAPAVDAGMLADYRRLSPDGPDHADIVIAKLTALWQHEPRIPQSALAGVTAPTLVMAGDHDSIRTDHTVEIARAIPGAQLAIVPGSSHELMTERPGLVNQIVLEFLASLECAAVG